MIKVVLLLGYLLSDIQTVIARLDTLSGLSSWIVFLTLYFGLAIGLFATAWISKTWLRLALGAIFASASVIQHSFEWTTHGPFTYQAYVNLYYASDHLDQALLQHGNTIFTAVASALLLFLGIALPPKHKTLSLKWTLTPPIMMLTALTGLLYIRGGEGSRALPASYAPLSYALLMSGESVFAGEPARSKPSLPKITAPIAEDIILIVDESISANYLDINHSKGVRSGLKSPPTHIKVHNFGYTAAIGNCSANSNIVLRFGGTQETYPQSLASWPSIWSYAKSAGMRTVFIDAQTAPGTLQNRMTKEERTEIDDLVQFDTTPVVQRDMEIADKIAKLTHNNVAEFIYINKIGAHFPVSNKTPDSRIHYRPTLLTNNDSMITWSSDRTDFSGSKDHWVLYRNSYRNTLEWNVGVFFDRLIPAVNWDKALIFYTSDHGQDLHERGNPGKNTHCGTEYAAQEEGLVPLVILQSATKHALDWSLNLQSNYNNTSAFRIFPSLLMAMGYDTKAMAAHYGKPLNEISNDSFAYTTNFAPLLGRKPSFRTIDKTDIATPPTTDFTKPN